MENFKKCKKKKILEVQRYQRREGGDRARAESACPGCSGQSPGLFPIPRNTEGRRSK